MVCPQRDPVLEQEVEQTATHVTNQTQLVHDCCHGCCQDCVNQEQRGCQEQEGELEGLGDTDQDCGEADGDQQSENFLALLGTSSGVERRCDTDGCEDLGVTVQCEAAAGEQFLQGLVALCELGQVGRPVLSDTVRGNNVTEDERGVDEVVQTGRDQEALEEGVNPHAECAGCDEEALQGGDAVLSVGPQPGEQECHGHHQEEASAVHKLGTLEDTEEVGQLLVEPAVVCPHHDCGDDDGTEDTGVHGLDTGNHLQTGTCRALRDVGGVVQVEETGAALAPYLEHGADEVVEGQVDHCSFHHCTCVSGLCQCNGQTDHEEQFHLIEDGPCAGLPNRPEVVPRAFLISSEGNQFAVLCNDRNTDREASECEEKNGCQHGRAEPLYFFHHEAIRPFGLSSERTQGLAIIAILRWSRRIFIPPNESI